MVSLFLTFFLFVNGFLLVLGQKQNTVSSICGCFFYIFYRGGGSLMLGVRESTASLFYEEKYFFYWLFDGLGLWVRFLGNPLPAPIITRNGFFLVF